MTTNKKSLPPEQTLSVNEIYLSLQGESTYAGLPCVFVRMKGCNLRCSYCDTAYAFFEGEPLSHEAVLDRIQALSAPYDSSSSGLSLPIIEFTGGEPLLQKGLLPLMARLCEMGRTVLVETSGAIDIEPLHPKVRRIMDLKCPSSGESDRMLAGNLKHLKPTDEIKFVVATLEDYRWMKERVLNEKLHALCPLLCSWAAPLSEDQQHPSLKPSPKETERMSIRELAESIIADALPVRFQLQTHKYIWPPNQRGV